MENADKLQVLQEQGALNPRPERVSDTAFRSNPFFDPRDLVQVKYEMVRRVQVDGQPVTQVAAEFGFSRPSFYQAQEALDRGGLPELVPKRRGPRGGHKMTDEVLAFVLETQAQESSIDLGTLAHRVEQRFGVSVHPRTIERALARTQKKLGRTPK